MTAEELTPPRPDGRYSRQMLFGPIGATGQARVEAGRVLVVGCGALGTGILEQLVRAGCGEVAFVDRDFVELSNLQRQSLFTESHAERRLPKAVAAAEALAAINSAVRLRPRVADFNHRSAADLAAGVDLILDGTDNFETRFLINELAVSQGIPWVYGACIGAAGTGLAVVAGRTPCLACLLPEPPTRAEVPTCDTVGVIAPAARVVAAVETALALRLLVEGPTAADSRMVQFDLWAGDWLAVDVSGARRPDCPVCGQRRFDRLAGRGATEVVVMCGRDMVQVRPAGLDAPRLDLADLAARLAACGPTRRNDHLLVLEVPPHELTVFPDGRCLIRGTADPDTARGLYARYIGH